MRVMRLPMLSICLVLIGPAAGSTEGPPVAEREAVDASTVMLPCVPVGTYWSGPLPAEGTPAAPDLAVVSIDTRPKDARVHLDDRFVGRARYLDGSPGYLYLEPGRYELELRLGGYETVSVDLEAEPGCRYDLKHRLQAVPAEPAERKDGRFGKGKPLQRVFAPVAAAAEPAPGTTSAGPDPRLRPDITRATPDVEPATVPTAALRLHVQPPSSAVWLDGAFVATGAELARMEAPLATTAGSHRISTEAPGHVADTRTVELEPGQVLEVEIVLDRLPGEDSL